MRKWAVFGAAAVFVAFLGYAGVAYADPIGGQNPCANNTCQGATYTLWYIGIPLLDSDPDHETFRIMLDIDTAGYAGGGGFPDTAAIKVSSTVFSSSLVGAPAGVGNWTLVPGGINAGVCSGNGFDCADYVAMGVGVPVGGLLSFIFDQTIDNGTHMTSLLKASIKARYVDSSGNKVGDLVSEPITLQTQTPVPAPSTLFLLGSGLAGVGFFGRKRLWKRRID